MKKQLFAVFALIAAAFAFSSPRIDAKPDGDSVIIITPGNNLGTPVHNRSTVPIEATYSSSLSSIIFSFNTDIGNVEVVVSNSCDGETFRGIINAYEAPACIPISCHEGLYTVSFSLSNGELYYGEFVFDD